MVNNSNHWNTVNVVQSGQGLVVDCGGRESCLELVEQLFGDVEAPGLKPAPEKPARQQPIRDRL